MQVWNRRALTQLWGSIAKRPKGTELLQLKVGQTDYFIVDFRNATTLPAWTVIAGKNDSTVQDIKKQ